MKFELRHLVVIGSKGREPPRLQFRCLEFDAAETLAGAERGDPPMFHRKWTEWRDVPTVEVLDVTNTARLIAEMVDD